jgi:AcrR family transcriptional regulator
MPRPRFTRAAPALQESLLDAAARVFAEHGYDGASLNAILLAAGLSKGAFYYYFDDKADLAAAVLERELRGFDMPGPQLGRTAAEFWSELARYSAESLDKLHESRTRSDLITRLGAAMAREPALLERCGDLISDAQRRMGELWRHGQKLGAVRTDLPLQALIALTQATKTSLTTALLPADRGATTGELAAFTRVYIDLLRRIAEPHGKEKKR